MEWLIIAGIFWILYGLVNRKKNTPSNGNYYPSSNPSVSKPMPKPNINLKQVDISNIKLSPEQQRLFDKLENTTSNMFITGKAGTGKSVLLQYFKQNSSKRLVVVAPTGVAALNVGGQTIHSLFRIPPAFITKDKLRLTPKTALLLRNLDTVVIDEISMVRADLMDAMDYLLQQARGSNLPFGGVQMVMFGDLYQLPPVVNDRELHKYFADNHGGYYFFHAHAWRNAPLEIYQLSIIFRQKDEVFRDILNSIRAGSFTDQLLSQLNARVTVEIPEEGIITLVTTNSLASEINNRKLGQLEGELREYRASVFGELEQSAFPTDEILRLKKGAQVMLIKNDREKKWVNGTIGFIHSLSGTEVKVDIGGIVYSVPKETWSKIRYYYNQEKKKVEEEVVSSFTQFPLKLAWALTIHKAQGQTYGTVAIDMGDGAFAHGQTYVALSRCKTLEGVYLKREILREDIMVDPAVVSFMDKAQILDIN